MHSIANNQSISGLNGSKLNLSLKCLWHVTTTVRKAVNFAPPRANFTDLKDNFLYVYALAAVFLFLSQIDPSVTIKFKPIDSSATLKIEPIIITLTVEQS